jgi:hypothetical protein
MGHVGSNPGTCIYEDVVVHFLGGIRNAFDKVSACFCLPFSRVSMRCYYGENCRLDFKFYVREAISLQHQIQQLILKIIEHVS